MVRGHAPHTVSCLAVHAVITNVPFEQLEHRAHVVSSFPAHVRRAYSPCPHAAHALQAHSLLTYRPTGHPVSEHGPHSVSRVSLQAVVTNVPFLQLEHLAQAVSWFPAHAREAYSPSLHIMHALQVHSLLRYCVPTLHVRRQPPHTRSCVPVHVES